MTTYQIYLDTKELAESLVAVPLGNFKGIMKAHGFSPAETMEVWDRVAFGTPQKPSGTVYLASLDWQHIYRSIMSAVAISIRMGDRLPDEQIPEVK